MAEKLALDLKGRVKLEDAGFDWKILGPDVQNVGTISFATIVWVSPIVSCHFLVCLFEFPRMRLTKCLAELQSDESAIAYFIFGLWATPPMHVSHLSILWLRSTTEISSQILGCQCSKACIALTKRLSSWEWQEEYVAWVCDQDAYACSGQKCSAQSILFMHEVLFFLFILYAI